MKIFEWDKEKNRQNFKKHRITFEKAKLAFKDPNRIVYKDVHHSTRNEKRYYCLGKIEDKVYTVRFTYRKKKIRIFGAAYWRKDKKIYEKKNQEK